MIVSTVANAYSVSDRLSDQSSRWRLVLALVGGNLSVLAGALALGAAIGWVALRAETADRPDTHTGQMHAVLVAEVAVLLLVAIVGIFNVALPSDDALFNGTVANRFGTIAYEAAAVVLTTAALLVLGSARAATGARPTGA